MAGVVEGREFRSEKDGTLPEQHVYNISSVPFYSRLNGYFSLITLAIDCSRMFTAPDNSSRVMVRGGESWITLP